MIAQELFDKVRKRIEMNRFGKNGVAEVYLLKFKMRCGYCGNTISADCGTSSKGKKVRYYACRGRKKLKNGCEKSAIRKESLESFVLNNIYETLSSEEETEIIVNELFRMQAERNQGNFTVKALEKEKRQTETALNNIVSAIEQGIISNTTNKRLHELETKMDDIDRKLLIEKNKEVFLLSKTDIKEFYSKALQLEPQMIINHLIDEIVLYNDKMVIKYKTPLKNGPDENRGFSFYERKVVMSIVIHNKKEPILQEILLVKKI